MHTLHLSGITLYPIKSLAGIDVSTAKVTTTGLQYDRQWMLVDEQGHFLSQRHLPKMALIKTALTSTKLVVIAPAMPDLQLSLTPPPGKIIQSIIWGDSCAGHHISVEADNWFSDYLQRNCRLVYLPHAQVRRVDPRYANASDQTAFSDGFPFLIIAQSSLDDLNNHLAQPVDMRRFRPNLVISGCGAYAEDGWRAIRIGHINFRLPKPCSRCVIPSIDPNTAISAKEPLITLNRLRRYDNKIYFGQNALHDQCGELSLGDELVVNEYGKKQPLL